MLFMYFNIIQVYCLLATLTHTMVSVLFCIYNNFNYLYIMPVFFLFFLITLFEVSVSVSLNLYHFVLIVQLLDYLSSFFVNL